MTHFKGKRKIHIDKTRICQKVHGKFRLGLEKWLYPRNKNSVSKVIGMVKRKKTELKNFITLLYQPKVL